jgi:hypothetical protein
VSRIVPGAALHDIVLPASRVVYDRDDGWLVEPFLPIECGPIRCTGYHELVGRTTRLLLPLRVGGVEHVLDRTYRITDTVKSMRGGRLEDRTTD